MGQPNPMNMNTTFLFTNLTSLTSALANLCLDRRQSFAIRCQTAPNADVNYSTVSDGASRGSAQSSSAAWALFAVSAHQMHLVVAGAVMFSSFASSTDAALAALELANRTPSQAKPWLWRRAAS